MSADIPKRVAEVREMAGLSQSKLANRMDISSSLVSHWEKGTRTPSNVQLLEIAQHLGVHIDYLLNSTIRPVFKLTQSQIDHLVALQKTEE